jgi:hypothetical protein
LKGISISSKHEKPVKANPIDKRLQRREANRQKQPHQISKFDKGQPKR